MSANARLITPQAFNSKAQRRRDSGARWVTVLDTSDLR
jgi:hypothetical protein